MTLFSTKKTFLMLLGVIAFAATNNFAMQMNNNETIKKLQDEKTNPKKYDYTLQKIKPNQPLTDDQIKILQEIASKPPQDNPDWEFLRQSAIKTLEQLQKK